MNTYIRIYNLWDRLCFDEDLDMIISYEWKRLMSLDFPSKWKRICGWNLDQNILYTFGRLQHINYCEPEYIHIDLSEENNSEKNLRCCSKSDSYEFYDVIW